MPTSKAKPQRPVPLTEYRGKQAKTGNSSGFRFEGALFKSHPEFTGEVTAHVLAPGRLLVTAKAPQPEKADPVMAAFLAFLAKEMVQSPGQMRPLDAKLAKRIDRLAKGVHVSPEETLVDDVIL